VSDSYVLLWIICRAFLGRDWGLRLSSNYYLRSICTTLLLFRFLSSVRIIRSFLFLLKFEPTRDAARCNRASRQMRIDSTGGDDQPLVEFHSREVLGFRFSLKHFGRSRASPSRQCTGSGHLKRNVPSIRHLSASKRNGHRCRGCKCPLSILARLKCAQSCRSWRRSMLAVRASASDVMSLVEDVATQT